MSEMAIKLRLLTSYIQDNLLNKHKINKKKDKSKLILPNGKFQEEKMRTRPRGSGSNSADDGNAANGNLACQNICKYYW